MRLVQDGPDCLADCGALFFDAVRNGAAPHYTEAQRAAWAPSAAPPGWMAEKLRRGVTWRAFDGAHPQGFATVTVLEAGAYLDLFFVAAQARRGPTAPLLYNAVMAWAAQGGHTTVTTHASLLLRPFLQRRGWHVAEEQLVRRGDVSLPRFAMTSGKLSQS